MIEDQFITIVTKNTIFGESYFDHSVLLTVQDRVFLRQIGTKDLLRVFDSVFSKYNTVKNIQD